MASIDGVIKRGADHTITLTITDTNGAARNITNDTIVFTVKYEATDASAILTKSTAAGGGIAKTNTTGGIATVTIADADFASVANSATLSAAVKVTDNANYDSIEALDLQLVVTAGG